MRMLLRVDGSTEVFDKPQSLAQIEKLIGAGCTDTVVLGHMGHPLHVMAVDDNGWKTQTVDHGNGLIEVECLVPLKPINKGATRLYLLNCIPGTTHQIAGDVFICPDSDFARA